MSNSRWKPYADIPPEGNFLVWAPNRPDGRAPYLNGNFATTKRTINYVGQTIATVDGLFHFDARTPMYYCEIDDLLAEVPIQPE